jgi:demethylsterigmatocystin 6-O-methyltransferase
VILYGYVVLEYSSLLTLAFISFDIAGQVFSKIPAWLRIHKTQDFAAELEAPFQFAVGNTKESFFPWLAKYESSLADFHAWMNSRQSGEHHWLDTYPMEQFLDKKKAESNTNKESTRVLMVDIGGGNGHESRLVKTKYPDLSGSIIFQDLTEVIEKCPSAPGVEGVVHDFFSPQPIHGK